MPGLDPPAPFHPTATRRVRTTVRVGVGVVVMKQGQLFAGIRQGSHGAGTLALPGGHLEVGESWAECAAREVQEEMNVTVENLRFLHVTNDIMAEEEKHYVTIFMIGTTEGTPVNAEPEKCTGWLSFSLTELQRMNEGTGEYKLFGPLKHLLEENPPDLARSLESSS